MPDDWNPPPPPIDAPSSRRFGRLGIALFVVLGGLGILLVLLATWGAGMAERLEQAETDGRALGRTADGEACVAEALRQLGASGAHWVAIDEMIFLDACLSVAERSSGLCEAFQGPRDELLASVQSRCEKVGHPTSACHSLFAVVYQHCAVDGP